MFKDLLKLQLTRLKQNWKLFKIDFRKSWKVWSCYHHYHFEEVIFWHVERCSKRGYEHFNIPYDKKKCCKCGKIKYIDQYNP